MMKDGLTDVFGPVRVYIGINGADTYTSALVTKAGARRGVIHSGYAD